MYNYNLDAIARASSLDFHSYNIRDLRRTRNGEKYFVVSYFMNDDKTCTYLSSPENEARRLSGKAREDIFLHVPLPFLSN